MPCIAGRPPWGGLGPTENECLNFRGSGRAKTDRTGWFVLRDAFKTLLSCCRKPYAETPKSRRALLSEVLRSVDSLRCPMIRAQGT